MINTGSNTGGFNQAHPKSFRTKSRAQMETIHHTMLTRYLKHRWHPCRLYPRIALVTLKSRALLAWVSSALPSNTDVQEQGRRCPLSQPFGWQLKVKVALSCPTLCDPVDYTVRGILQARILEWVAFPFSRGSSQPRDQTQVSRIAGRFFTSWATREVYTHYYWI